MSRTRSRTRHRRARVEELRAAFEANRRCPQALWAFLVRLAGSPDRVWDVVRGHDLDDDERAMVMQSVAPHLAGMTPASVTRRLNWKPAGD